MTIFHIFSILVLNQVLALKLISSSFNQNTLFGDSDGWDIQQGNAQTYTTCNTKALFGGYLGFDGQTVISKYFSFPPHYLLSLSFEIVLIDMSTSENVYANIDQTQQTTLIPMTAENKCGLSLTDSTQQINFLAFHYYPTAIISIFTDLTSGNWGIRDFEIYIEECPVGCQMCFYNSDKLECSQWKLVYSTWDSLILNELVEEGWSKANILGKSTCAGLPIIGGYQQLAEAARLFQTFKLPAHTQVAIFFRYFFIDNWAGELANLRMYHNSFQVTSDSIPKKNLCGASNYDDQIKNFGLIIDHFSEILEVEFTNDLASFSDSFLGIRDFSVYIYKLNNFCGDGFLDDEEMCDDGNLDPFDGCHGCQITCLDGCSECINGLCVNCISGFIYNEIQNSCEYQFQIEVNQIIELQNQVLDINCVQIYQQNYCLACKIGFELQNNNQCVPICGDGMIVSTEQCDSNQQNCNNCKLQCQLECLQCEFGKCLKCQDGYELFNNQYCKPKCGDLVIIKDEQCEDGNDIRYDGCYQCQNDCQTSCLLCNVGQCWLCDDGWILNDGKCESICGDSLIAIGQEECDDGNNIKNDGCYDCKIECSDNNCSECQMGVCQACVEPFVLNNQICQIRCGDGYVSIGYEECDDGNDLPYDGCFECKFQCSKNCRICKQGICQDECGQGEYLFNNNLCDSICGDGIVAKNEMCEDGNTIQFDGCFNCQYSCPLNCDTCIKGICYQCIDGFEFIDQQCFPRCGDGKIASPYEECDDFNQVDLDGCDKNCKIEPDWICQNFQDTFSQCSYSESPQMILTLLKQKYDTVLIELVFTQKISAEVANFTSFIKVELLNVSIEKYEIKLDEITPINQTLQNSQIKFTLKFLEQYDSDFIFKLSLEQPVYNDQGLKLKNPDSQLQLKQPIVLSQYQKKTAEKMKNYNLIILLISCILALIFLCTGKINLFFEILDILQQQSFYKYINVNVPQNLSIYFESSDVINLQSLLKYFFDFDNLNSNIFQLPIITPYCKFSEYDLNADILQNLQNIIVFISLLLICGKIFKLTSKFLYSLRISSKQKLKFQIYCFITNLSFVLYRNFNNQGLEVITYSNSFDLFFFSFLQLSVFVDYYRSLLAIATVFITISVTIQTKEGKGKRIMILLKKLGFLACLVFFQNSQVIQTVMLGIFQTIHLSYLIATLQEDTSAFNFIKDHISDISYFLIVIINFCYWEQFSGKISYQNQIILSWTQMGLLSAPLVQLTVFEIARSLTFVYCKFKKIVKPTPKRACLPFQECKL